MSQRGDGDGAQAVDPGGGPARATPPRTMKLSSLGKLILLLLLATIGPVRGQARERVELTIAGLFSLTTFIEE